MIIINKAHLCTRLTVWTPRYSDVYGQAGEYVALLHKNKVDFAGSGVIIVEFPKAKHLEGQRFAISKQDAQRCRVGSNGTASMYEVPMSKFESYRTSKEILEDIDSLGW